MQKSFKGAWGQISPTSEKWLQAALLASPFSVLQRHTIFNRGRARQNTIKDRTPRFRATLR
ncbi:hypothetical protein CE91St36_17490 [Christensenellaceae bacterium]|nr:hypothetical protein CE91St36_17490 [Christensenellaceae bacterium]BDF61600.1 hypothetical protein CE91St37_17500 [Christensenellaceae bacterium]